MAQFAFNYTFQLIFVSGGNLALAGGSQQTGTLVDDDADAPNTGTFETGDPITGPGATPGFEYLGSFSNGGETVIVVGNPTNWASPSSGNAFYGYVDATNPETYSATGVISKSTVLSDPVAVTCFAAGTLIATPEGEETVESLTMGDLVTTAEGRAVPIKWIGRQTLHKVFTPEQLFCPVRIKAGALDENVPHSNLVVTPDHGIMIEGIMVNAGALVDGTSIVRVPIAELAEKVVYYHIELENHDVVLANGAEAETFLDNANRRGFDNYAEFVDLYGEGPSDMAMLPYARALSRRQLPQQVRDFLAARASLIAELKQAAA